MFYIMKLRNLLAAVLAVGVLLAPVANVSALDIWDPIPPVVESPDYNEGPSTAWIMQWLREVERNNTARAELVDLVVRAIAICDEIDFGMTPPVIPGEPIPLFNLPPSNPGTYPDGDFNFDYDEHCLLQICNWLNEQAAIDGLGGSNLDMILELIYYSVFLTELVETVGWDVILEDWAAMYEWLVTNTAEMVGMTSILAGLMDDCDVAGPGPGDNNGGGDNGGGNNGGGDNNGTTPGDCPENNECTCPEATTPAPGTSTPGTSTPGTGGNNNLPQTGAAVLNAGLAGAGVAALGGVAAFIKSKK